jgi:OmpA-OmpF porin, OOP family
MTRESRNNRNRLAVWAALCVASRPCFAEAPGLDLTGFEPPGDARGSPLGDSTRPFAADEFQAAFYGSYAWRGVRLENAAGRAVATPLAHRHQLHYNASFGLAELATLSVDQPLVLEQRSETPSPELANLAPLPRQAVGDLRLRLKRTLRRAETGRGLGLAVQGSVKLPTGSPASFASDSGVVLGGKGLAELRWLALGVFASLGVEIPTRERSLLGQSFGSALPYAFAIELQPELWGWDTRGRSSLTLGGRGALGSEPEFAAELTSPLALGLYLQRALQPLRFTLGGEMSLNSAAGLPLLRALVGVAFAPELADSDADGVPDERDACPLEVGVRGAADGEGCPP